MFIRDEIHRAVDLHRRSYKLLRWLSTAISKGFVQFDRAHDYMDEAEKLSRRDKERARKLKVAVLQQLALEQNMTINQAEAEKLIDSPDTTTEVSLVAYGQQLFARTEGRSDGPAVLALWREIAWTKSGSPRKNFQLEAESILNAKELVAQRILGV